MKAFQSANFVTDNYYSIERVYISNQNFGILKKNETLPAFAENIKSIELSSNAISDIENGTFDKFNQLETLKISGNKLKNLSSGVLTEKLGKTLTTLRLNEYQLSVTSIDFKYMTNLNTLDLDNNNYIDKVIASSTWTFPKSLSNLTTLILNYCNITNISENAFENLR
uniref:Uncharacterized protein n=1 Tax=Panagrolaimus superbus TaxID=310955 RepID=A0A914Z0M4_9BILA